MKTPTPQQSIRDVLEELSEYFQSVEHFDTKAALAEDKEVLDEAQTQLLNIIEGLLPEEHVCTDICNISCKEWKIGHKAYKDAEHNIISEIRERLNK